MMDHEEFKAQLGRWIRDSRKELSFTLADLAAKAGMSKSYISEMENGHKDPRISTLVKIATALDMNVSDLMAGRNAGYWRGYNSALDLVAKQAKGLVSK